MRFSSTVMPVRSADRSHALVLALIITASLASSRGQELTQTVESGKEITYLFFTARIKEFRWDPWLFPW
ncbi:hypothetical protein QTP70_034156 [Hemibagrus guttatus]|uniref:Uncharacterized protein n=1 Tax=Hemibagrus guttatus TaxID=175788 RepID=A0AAE0UXU1_9TELE|nr:hypothetical protein QTP70_034156 [Hemibagrus guttatus]